MFGPEIVARSLSIAAVMGRKGERWQYHPRSDRHSKVACWALLFDLMQHCDLLREHILSGQVAYGINHQMVDFKQDRKKDLDLVVCRPVSMPSGKVPTFSSLVSNYGIVLTIEERAALERLPELRMAPVGAVLVALEAKACMTAHIKAIPRLYDELNSSHQTVHGSAEIAIAAGLVMVNLAKEFISPGRAGYCPNCGHTVRPVNEHRQPADTERVISKAKQLPRRSSSQGDGFDALGVIVVECRNDGSPVKLINDPPAPAAGEPYHYPQMIARLTQLYESRFPRA